MEERQSTETQNFLTLLTRIVWDAWNYGEVNLRDLQDITCHIEAGAEAHTILVESQEEIPGDTGKTILAQMIRFPLSSLTPAYRGRGAVPVQGKETETLMAIHLT